MSYQIGKQQFLMQFQWSCVSFDTHKHTCMHTCNPPTHTLTQKVASQYCTQLSIRTNQIAYYLWI